MKSLYRICCNAKASLPLRTIFKARCDNVSFEGNGCNVRRKKQVKENEKFTYRTLGTMARCVWNAQRVRTDAAPIQCWWCTIGLDGRESIDFGNDSDYWYLWIKEAWVLLEYSLQRLVLLLVRDAVRQESTCSQLHHNCIEGQGQYHSDYLLVIEHIPQ